jgi:hypothetical protein
MHCCGDFAHDAVANLHFIGLGLVAAVSWVRKVWRDRASLDARRRHFLNTLRKRVSRSEEHDEDDQGTAG